MSSGEVARWQGKTPSHAFTVQIFGNRRQGPFNAYIQAPAFRDVHKDRTGLEDPAQIVDLEDFEVLKALTRNYIKGRFGEILQWQEYPPGQSGA